MQVAIVSSRPYARAAASTVASASACALTCVVLDVDGTYAPCADEDVLAPQDVGCSRAELHRWALLGGYAALSRHLAPRLVRHVLSRSDVALHAAPGIIFLEPPHAIVGAARAHGLGFVAPGPALPPPDGRWPSPEHVLADGARSGALAAFTLGAPDGLDAWSATADAGLPAGRVFDLVAAGRDGCTVSGSATLLSAQGLRPSHRVDVGPTGGLTLDGAPVAAVDLSAFDPRRPWLLHDSPGGDPRGRLSDHPALAAWVATRSATMLHQEVRTPAWDLSATGWGEPLDETTRAAFRHASTAARVVDLPDLYDAGSRDAVHDWLTRGAPGAPSPYLAAVRRERPDLVRAFEHVPGRDTARLVAWAARHGASDPRYRADLVQASVDRAPTTPQGPARPGVNLVGYLGGELGIGESARLMGQALTSAGLPHALVPIDRYLSSPRRAAPEASAAVFDTTLLCVNADLTPAVQDALPPGVDRSYRIGMWYWEVEDFPATSRAAFGDVDEVWVATDFIRAAVEPHSPVPVRTVTPPLPQRPDPGQVTRESLGLPEGFLFLFAFDYLSTAARKNPLGLLDAFTRAFAPGEGPGLVLKTLNSALRPAEAEQVRLAAASRPDVLLLESYLQPQERDALVSLCDSYVSLHRSEGLGLTMAEAMACGKPVIATGYSGNLQFMTTENSYLVPWTAGTIPSDASPYPPGGTWAEPDVEAAAALMRDVVDRPEVARLRGERAALDIARLHSPEAAGERVRARLDELAGARRARARRARASGLVHRAQAIALSAARR